MAAQAVACPHADTDGLRLAPPGPEELEVAAAMAAIALADSPPYAFACGGSAVAREGVLRTLFARNMWVAHRQGCCWGAYEEAHGSVIGASMPGGPLWECESFVSDRGSKIGKFYRAATGGGDQAAGVKRQTGFFCSPC